MRNRNQALDVLRGVAILLVVAHHYGYFRIFLRSGWIGVDLFFVLSGFLISGLLFEEFQRKGGIDLRRFWIRRGFKIYPSFYVLFLVTAVGALASPAHVGKRLLICVLFLQSYFPGEQILGHTWSLSVEEHFYFGLPVLLVCLIWAFRSNSNPFSSIPWIFGVVGLGCLTLRFIGFEHAKDNLDLVALYTNTHLRIDSLFAGVLLSYWYHFHPHVFRRVASRPVWLASIPLLVPPFVLFRGTMFMLTIGFTFLYLGFACVLACSVDLPSSKNPVPRSIAWIGKYSYSIYLWQLPLRAILPKSDSSLTYFLFDATFCIFFGVIMAKLVEMPSLEIRDRLFPKFAAKHTDQSRSQIAASAISGSPAGAIVSPGSE